jgi:hypothetical protein
METVLPPAAAKKLKPPTIAVKNSHLALLPHSFKI